MVPAKFCCQQNRKLHCIVQFTEMSADDILLDMEVGHVTHSPPTPEPLEQPSQTTPEAGNQASSNELANGGNTGTTTSTIANNSNDTTETTTNTKTSTSGPGPGRGTMDVGRGQGRGGRGRGRGRQRRRGQ